jgi:hypothetical protein
MNSKRRLILDAPVSRAFSFRLWSDSLPIVSLEARYAVEEALENCKMDDQGNILEMQVHLALARRPFGYSGVCYGSFHTPPAMLPEDYIISYTVDAAPIAAAFFARGETGENDLIMEIAAWLLPEFKRRSLRALVQDAAKQSNL